MLRAIAGDCDLTKTTLQHVKSVLSGIFTHAKNEGAFDGVNPVTDARIPGSAREPGETYAYNLNQNPAHPGGAAATAAGGGGDGLLCWLARERIVRAGVAGLQQRQPDGQAIGLEDGQQPAQNSCQP